MERKIKQRPALVEFVSVDSLDDVKEWLEMQGARHNLRWLLAHADDGVIWGELRNGRLVTSNSVAPKISPPLHSETLQQARLFAQHAELLLWRDGNNQWHARLIRDAIDGETATFTDAIDEPQILWGTNPQPLDNDFTLMRDGDQGLQHVVPLVIKGKFDEASRPLRLWVRHYLKDDANGFTRIVASRLLDLRLEEAKWEITRS